MRVAVNQTYPNIPATGGFAPYQQPGAGYPAANGGYGQPPQYGYPGYPPQSAGSNGYPATQPGAYPPPPATASGGYPATQPGAYPQWGNPGAAPNGYPGYPQGPPSYSPPGASNPAAAGGMGFNAPPSNY